MRKLILKWYVIYMIKRLSFEEKVRQDYERMQAMFKRDSE